MAPKGVPSKLSTDQKEEVIRLYYCSLHYYGATGNVNTCPMCVRGYIKRHHGADVLDHTPVHLAPQDDPDNTTCGLARPFVSTSFPRRVTCPDCLIVDYFEQEGVTNPVDNWEPAPLPPKPEPGRIIGYHCATHNFHCTGKMALQLHVNGTFGDCAAGPVREDAEPSLLPPKPEPAEPPHVGPHWEHDCESCIYLGSVPHCDRQYDLYWCPPEGADATGNIVARHGIMGDYVSGMNWILREPILATAAVMAMRQGHLSPMILRDRRMY